MELWFIMILVGLMVIAALYSSVGHGGASGYLAILSLTAFATRDSAWLKQQAWCLNLLVAALAFYHYRRGGHHIPKLTIPFIVASIPFAVVGGYMNVGGEIYDILLSITLVWAAWRLLSISDSAEFDIELSIPEMKVAAPVGGVIGFLSGIIGVGGGIFLSPIVLLKKWATPKAAAATAALFIWVNSAAGLVGSALSGQLVLELNTLVWFLGAVLVGGIFGSRYGAYFASQNVVRKILVVVLVIAAVKRLLEMANLIS